MKNFVDYFDEMPRRNARNDAEFVSGTVVVDSPDAALHLLGVTDENASIQMKLFKKASDLVIYYNGYIRKLLKKQIREGVFVGMDFTRRINERNRNVAADYVKRLAKDMKDNKFKTISPQGLVFYVYNDENGRYQRMLIDGQNRLLACLLSGVTVEFNVQLTNDTKVFSVLDQCKPRMASTVANNALYEKVGPAASLLQKDMPYLAPLVLGREPGKDSRIHVQFYSYLKNNYTNNIDKYCRLVDVLNEYINDESYESVFISHKKNKTDSINQVFVGGMLRVLIEAIETRNADAQRKVFRVIKQLANMLNGEANTRHAYELDRVEPYLKRMFMLSNGARGHRDSATYFFYSMFSSIVFNRKDGFNAMMDRFGKYRDELMDEDKFKDVMSITTKETRKKNAVLMDKEGNPVYLVHEILTQDLKDDLRHFEPYRKLILTRNVDMDDAA